MTLLQSTGIIGGLFFSATSLRIDAKARRISNLIQNTEQHRGLWAQIYREPQLLSVLGATVDVRQNPVTGEEKRFSSY